MATITAHKEQVMTTETRRRAANDYFRKLETYDTATIIEMERELVRREVRTRSEKNRIAIRLMLDCIDAHLRG